MNNSSYSADGPASLKYSMANGNPISWDGLRLHPKGSSSPWRKAPSNVPLVKNPVFVPQGTPLPLKNEERYVQLPNPSMFVFAHNQSSLACCPSTYSSDRGCVCTNAQQRELIGAERGNNKNYPSDSF